MIEIFEPYRNEAFTDFNRAGAVEAYRTTLEAVRHQLGRDYPLIIGGEQVTTGDYLESSDPCNIERIVGRSAKAREPEIERAMAAATDAFESWSRLPMEHRARCLIKLAAVMRRRKAELCAWETFEAGKNYSEADGDVAEGIDFCEYYAREALRLARPLRTYDYPGEENTTFLIPMGVGVVIPPWNFLLAILVGTTIGPVVVGNTVIVKPSPNTPIIAQKFMECVEEAGFPPGVINLLTGDDADLGDQLVDHASTRFINFTGSLGTGLRIHERAIKMQPGQRYIKKVFAEMGGKDALIVDETADLELAAQAAVASGFDFQGQKCSAMSRLIVVDEVYDEMVERVVAGTKQLSVGPAEENFDVTAVINERQYRKILDYIEKGGSEGRLVAGGGKAEGAGNGWYIEPTVFADVPPEATIACEEIFGPVVSIVRARDFDHALSIANSLDYALTAGVCSRSRARLERARRELEAGNIYFNRKITGALVGVQPFGGFKMSGDNAKAGGPDYLRLFMLAKTVTERF
ncbi:MAG: L-glutamate gamma-semialdehyde dehydrogenase [Trueperaceae bacterium]